MITQLLRRFISITRHNRPSRRRLTPNLSHAILEERFVLSTTNYGPPPPPTPYGNITFSLYNTNSTVSVGSQIAVSAHSDAGPLDSFTIDTGGRGIVSDASSPDYTNSVGIAHRFTGPATMSPTSQDAEYYFWADEKTGSLEIKLTAHVAGAPANQIASGSITVNIVAPTVNSFTIKGGKPRLVWTDDTWPGNITNDPNQAAYIGFAYDSNINYQAQVVNTTGQFGLIGFVQLLSDDSWAKDQKGAYLSQVNTKGEFVLDNLGYNPEWWFNDSQGSYPSSTITINAYDRPMHRNELESYQIRANQNPDPNNPVDKPDQRYVSEINVDTMYHTYVVWQATDGIPIALSMAEWNMTAHATNPNAQDPQSEQNGANWSGTVTTPPTDPATNLWTQNGDGVLAVLKWDHNLGFYVFA